MEKNQMINDKDKSTEINSFSFEISKLIAKVNQAHQLFESNLYQDSIKIFNDIIIDSNLYELPQQRLQVYTDLGLIYRNDGQNNYDSDLLKKSIYNFCIAAKISKEMNDFFNYALINKYLGTVHTILSCLEDSEMHLNMAGECYDASLSIFTETDYPDESSKVLINYGNLYLYYSNIRSSRNFLKNAISYFEKAIKYYEDIPYNYFKALTYLNCSCAYANLSEICNTKVNADYAIEMLHNALNFFTIEDYPIQYAQCVSNLGLVHYFMANYFDTIDNCNKAINYILHALNIVSVDIDASSYLIANLNLSVVYTLLSNKINETENITKAIQSIEKCEKHYNIHSNSINDFKANLNHAEALLCIAESNKNIDYIELAKTILIHLLEIANTYQYDYFKTVTKYNLARLYYIYFIQTQDNCYLNFALNYAYLTLEIYTIHDYPLGYALTMHLIAKIYNCQHNYENCKEAYESVLTIFTKEKYPEKNMSILDEYNYLLQL